GGDYNICNSRQNSKTSIERCSPYNNLIASGSFRFFNSSGLLLNDIQRLSKYRIKIYRREHQWWKGTAIKNAVDSFTGVREQNLRASRINYVTHANAFNT